MESTLKELCLKAVILHKNRLILFRVEELKNLRKKQMQIYSQSKKPIELHVFDPQQLL
jgi:hypothetical protein